jgi:hypothetical protein
MSKTSRAAYAQRTATDNAEASPTAAATDSPPSEPSLDLAATPSPFGVVSLMRQLAQPDRPDFPEPTDPIPENPGAGMVPEAALLLCAYLRARVKAQPGNADFAPPLDVLAFARNLRRSNALLWGALMTGDCVRLTRALDFSGWPMVDAGKLQDELAEIAREVEGSKPAPSRPLTPGESFQAAQRVFYESQKTLIDAATGVPART